MTTTPYAPTIALDGTRKALRSLTDAAQHGNALEALKHLGDVDLDLDALRADLVDHLRRDGHTWQSIAVVLGVSRQAAQQRYGR